MIRGYLDEALRRATYDKLEDGTFVSEVPDLQGVLAHGATLEACREQLAEVIEEWILVRVARGLAIPPLAGIEISVKKAS
ncbi:MAG: type II toxin-antitoxin system HicB family antitoxin [Proteobacteria bacterium]|nr:type II toxin-antitoxin system HicB family antitoxin [Pseudomonadota bacterium]